MALLTAQVWPLEFGSYNTYGEHSKSAATWVTQIETACQITPLQFYFLAVCSVQHSWATVYKQWHFPPAFHGSLETFICYASVADQRVQPPMILHDIK